MRALSESIDIFKWERIASNHDHFCMQVKHFSFPSKWSGQSWADHTNIQHCLTPQPAIWQGHMGARAMLLGFITEHREPIFKKQTLKYIGANYDWCFEETGGSDQGLQPYFQSGLIHLYNLIILVNISHVILQSYVQAGEILPQRAKFLKELKAVDTFVVIFESRSKRCIRRLF